jgi:hypothetical protein
VRVEEVEVDHRLQDNSFEAKVIKQLSIFW